MKWISQTFRVVRLTLLLSSPAQMILWKSSYGGITFTPLTRAHPRGWGWLQPRHPSKCQKSKFKSTDFVDMLISKVLFDLLFSWCQPLKIGNDYWIRIFKNELMKLKRNMIGHRTCSYICMNINAVASSVMVQ